MTTSSPRHLGRATKPHLVCCGILLSFLCAMPALAQDKGGSQGTERTVMRDSMTNAQQDEVMRQPQDKIYSGVIPGTRDSVKHIEGSLQKGKSSSASQLTWVGFAPEDNRTRVFIQMGGEHNYEMSRSKDGRSIILTYSNTKIGARNVTRPIDTSGYKRDVTGIQVKNKGRGKVVVSINVKDNASPQITQEGPFLYLDFAYTKPEPNAQ